MHNTSITIPVFYTSIFLSKYLEYISAQTRQNIEIICIDRGYTHKSKQILHNFQQKHFGGTDNANEYFDKIYKIFVTRILELNVMPEWNRDRYNGMVKLLEEKDLRYILTKLAVKYPYADTSFPKFKAYHQYLALKSKIYKFIHRA